MKIPFVKEWGSWVVFVSSSIAALIVSQRTGSSEGGAFFDLQTIMTVLGLAVLINAKNPLASLVRSKGRNREDLLWTFLFSTLGLIMISPVLIKGLGTLALFLLLVPSYLILLSIGKEHSIVAELNGFALFSLSAPIVYLSATGNISLTLYIAVLIFFGAGVFKVRVRLKKTPLSRWIMAFYVLTAFAIFYFMSIPVILLLPLFENLISVILMREEKLRTTGYIEMTKGIFFLILMGTFWQ